MGLRVSARTSEVKKPGRKEATSFVLFYFILNASVHTGWLFFCLVKPCNFSLYLTIIYIFLGLFFPSLRLR